jgi:hypothetical protein
MAGLVAAIHVDVQGAGAWGKRDRSRPNRRREPTARRSRTDVDDRDKPGHDGFVVGMAPTLGVAKFALNKFNTLIYLMFHLLSTKMSSYRGLKWGRGSASQRLRTKQGMGVVAIPIRRHQLALLIASIAS